MTDEKCGKRMADRWYLERQRAKVVAGEKFKPLRNIDAGLIN